MGAMCSSLKVKDIIVNTKQTNNVKHCVRVICDIYMKSLDSKPSKATLVKKACGEFLIENK